MALDIGGNWEAGDDLRLLEAMLMQFSEYSLQGLQACMNQLETISPDAVLRIKESLNDYDNAKSIQETQNLSNIEGKVLTKADVLEWEANKTGESGPIREIISIRNKLMNYFSFCPYTPHPDDLRTTALIRS